MGCIHGVPKECLPSMGCPHSIGCLHSKTTDAPAVPGDVPQRPISEPNDSSHGQMYLAVYDYEARTEHDLNFKKGQRILVIDKSNRDWWIGRINDQSGYVPSNYVSDVMSRLGPWFHNDINRRDAERLLSESAVGTFLVRNRDASQAGSGYSLSVRAMHTEEAGRSGDVRHYKIYVVQDGGDMFYISEKIMFSSLEKLVAHYRNNDDGLCIKLGEPCPKTAPTLNDLSAETADKWEIPREDIEFIALLGSGQFGEVWAAWYRQKNKVAVKTMKPGTMKPDDFLKEAKIMKKLQHKHLVRLYAVCTKEEPMYIVTELVGRGCLLKFLREHEGKRFDIPKLIGMSADVAEAMVYLESLNFIHRDLAARNVLVDHNFSCKVCDFGLARCLTEDTYQASRGAKFPIKWTAPEAASYGYFTIKSDVWSFGILMFEVITRGKTPYSGFTSNREVLEQVENGYRMPRPEGCPDDYYDLMRICWTSEAKKRPTFEHLCRALSDFTTHAEKAYE